MMVTIKSAFDGSGSQVEMVWLGIGVPWGNLDKQLLQ